MLIFVVSSQDKAISRMWCELIYVTPVYFSMVPNRVTCEMVLDGGGQFIPAGIDGFHTLFLLLAFLVAHDRATEDTHTHTGKERLCEHQTNTLD